MDKDNSQRGRVIAFPRTAVMRTPSPAGAAAATGRRRLPSATIALLPGSYGIRFTASHGPNAMDNGFESGTDDKRRLHVRHREGITMKTIERIIHTVSRFAVGFGSGIALVCAYVIVTTDVGLGPSPATRPVDAIRLDPVVVTISSGRYDAIRAESAGAAVLVGTPDTGTRPG